MSQLPTLHDAIIESIRLVWSEGRCIVELDTAERPVQLVFSGVRSVLVPREQPWGPSASVNAFRSGANGSFEIELQSGDVVQIQAAELQVT